MSISRTARRLVSVSAELRQPPLRAPQFRTISTTTPNASSTSTSSPISPPSSVSETEKSHFAALASTWWDPHGSSRILHLMNPLRHEFISQCEDSVILKPQPQSNHTPTSNSSAPPLQRRRYLDIGCGGGIFAESAARISPQHSVTGIDPTPSVIEIATAHARRDPALTSSSRLRYLNCAIEDLSLPSTPQEGYDIVSLFEVVEHVSDPTPFLQNCLKQVKPGGWFVGSTMSRTWASWFTTKFVAEEVMRVVPRGTHDWRQYIDASEMEKWARKQKGWGEWRVMGVIYVPGLGWKEVNGSEGWGNYFFGIQRLE